MPKIDHMAQATPDQEALDLIGSGDACTLLRIDRSTLSRWVSSGKLSPAMRLPGARGAFLFRRDHVEQLAHDERLVSAGDVADPSP